MDSVPTLACTPSASWALALAYVLPPVGALLSATALLVASRARSTSVAARSTSEALLRTSGQVPVSLAEIEQALRAQDRRRS